VSARLARAELSAESEALRNEAAVAFAEWQSALTAALEDMKDRGFLGTSARPGELAETTLALIQGGYLRSTQSAASTR